MLVHNIRIFCGGIILYNSLHPKKNFLLKRVINPQNQNSNRAKTIVQQKEANNINVSLMQLWRCLQGIKKKNSELSIPFRDSKLTHLLMPELCRSGLLGVAMIACINPLADDYDDTLSILGEMP